MKKDLEWLKGRFRGRKIFTPQNDREIGYNMAIDEFSEYVDQLDEPEVLSQEWIGESKDEGLTLYGAMRECPRELDYWFIESDSTNQEKFAKAWLDGYEVEEEQKYYVILEENSYGAMGLGIGREGRLTFTATHDKWSLPKLTEQEIKDYDERFWPFAVKVEELEE